MARRTAMARLVADAKNRSWRTALQGLAIDVGVAVVLVLSTTFASANDWGAIEWALLSFSVAKSVLQAIAAYVMRRYLDKSRVPTPLPPDDPGRPADDTGQMNLHTAATIGIFILTALLVAWAFGWLPRPR